MKVARIKFFRYSLPLKAAVTLGKSTMKSREGLIIQIVNNGGLSGFGEIAPLPGFSRETLAEAESQALQLSDTFSGETDSTQLEESLDRLYTSVRFGIESALLDLEAKQENVSISQVLNKTPRKSVSVNGLLTGSRAEILKNASKYVQKGYKAVKLKVGSSSLIDDIRITKKVRNAIEDEMLLRLDANRAWSIDNALKFCDAVEGCVIDYLEEPVSDSNSLHKILKKSSSSVPIALDETTREISPDELSGFANVKALVLKPSLLGLKKTLQYAERAHSLEIIPVIGSSFESGLGLSILAQIAAAVNYEDFAAGLDTYSWFAEDLIPGSLPVKNGRVNIVDLVESETVLDSPLLREAVTI